MELSAAREFLNQHHRSVLVATKPDGRPQPSPVIHGIAASGQIHISSRETAYKVRNLRRDPRVSLCAFSNQFFGPWVVAEGQASIISLPEAMEPLIELYRSISGEHPDWADYRAAMIREQRVIVAIDIERAGPDVSG